MENEPLTQEQWDNLRKILLSKVNDPEKFHSLRNSKLESIESQEKEINKPPQPIDINKIKSFGQIFKPLPRPDFEISKRQQLQNDLNDPILHKEILAKLKKSDRYQIDYDGCGWIVY